MSRIQGEGSPTATVVFLSHLAPAILGRALAPVFDPTQVFCSQLGCGDDWPDVELELNVVWPHAIVTVGEPATCLVLGDVALAQIHGSPYRVGDFLVVPIHAPSPPPWHVRFACDLQALHGYLYPKPSPAVAPTPTMPAPRRTKPKPASPPRLWKDGDLP